MKFLLLCFVLCVGYFCKPLFAANEHQVELRVQNTFPISVTLEVKCDIISGTYNQYKLYKRIVVPKKSFFVLKVPNNLKHCECWTLDYKLF